MSYTITVQRESDSEQVVSATGSLGLIAYAAREAIGSIKESADDFSALIESTENGETRTVAKVAGDADVVSVVVKKKLTKERAANAPAEDEDNAETTETTETTETASTGRRSRAQATAE